MKKLRWFELIGTAGRTFSFMHAADGFAVAAGTELCKVKRLVSVVASNRPTEALASVISLAFVVYST